MFGTLKAFLAFCGSLSNTRFKVSVVVMGVPLGVPREMLVDCMSAFLHFAFPPKLV